MLLKGIAGALSPAGRQGRLTILMFHRVLPAPDPVRSHLPDVVLFEAMLAWLKSVFNVIPLDEAVERLRTGSLPSRAAAITFDDGYADNHLLALPVIRKHGLHATFFISTGFLDGGVMWNDALAYAVRGSRLEVLDCSGVGLGVHPLASSGDRAAALRKLNRAVKHLPYAERSRIVEGIVGLSGVELPKDLMLTTDQLRALRAAGMGIGAHTVTHPILAACDDAFAHGEIADGKAALEDVLKEEVRLFAYPNGKPDADYRSVHVEMVRGLGFRAAVSTSFGAACGADDRYQLPRFTPWGNRSYRFTGQMLKNLLEARRHPPITASR